MSHSSATDWPPDLGDFTTMLLDSMNQVMALVVLRISQTQGNPDFEDECPKWASNSPVDSTS